MATELQWKQFIEGMGRGDVGPLNQRNIVDGNDCIREYLAFGVVVASMRVHDSNTDKLGHECKRTFTIHADFLCPDVRILTEEELSEWDEFDGDDDRWLFDHGQVL